MVESGGPYREAVPGWGRYPAYKDSGVEWLGEVPAHWEVRRLKATMANIVDQTVLLSDNHRVPDFYVAMEHVESWTGQVRVPLGSEGGVASDGQVVKRFRAGDVLFGKLRPYLAKVTRLDRSGVCVGEFLVLRARHRGVLATYMEDLLRSKPIIDTVNSSTVGAKMPRADWQVVAGLRVPLPPIRDQRCIADFLDRETVKTNALVAKQQELIGLLQEKRSALICHAVTKGLDTDVAMKDSGVEWLGEIPAHWDVKRVKRAARMESGHTPDKKVDAYWNDGDVPWVSLSDTGHLKDHDYISDTEYYTNELGLRNSSARLLPPHSVIFSRDATIGLCAITERPMAVSQHYIAWICHETLLPEYLLRVFGAMMEELVRLTMGATLRTIGMPDVQTLTMPLPSLAEQDRIVAFVRKETTAIDALIAKAGQAIDHLNEYRSALISAAVTGKIDVRHALEPDTTSTPTTPHPTP